MEGSAQLGQQLFGFLIGGGGGADADIHTTDLVHLVVLDFGEDQLLLQTEEYSCFSGGIAPELIPSMKPAIVVIGVRRS